MASSSFKMDKPVRDILEQSTEASILFLSVSRKNGKRVFPLRKTIMIVDWQMLTSILVIVWIIIGVLLYLAYYHPHLIGDKLGPRPIRFLQTVAVTISLTVFGLYSFSLVSASSETSRAEYGLFSRKKKEVNPIPQVQAKYGNPMKQQNYVPASGIPTTAKTDTSKIYRKFS